MAAVAGVGGMAVGSTPVVVAAAYFGPIAGSTTLVAVVGRTVAAVFGCHNCTALEQAVLAAVSAAAAAAAVPCTGKAAFRKVVRSRTPQHLRTGSSLAAAVVVAVAALIIGFFRGSFCLAASLALLADLRNSLVFGDNPLLIFGRCLPFLRFLCL